MKGGHNQRDQEGEGQAKTFPVRASCSTVRTIRALVAKLLEVDVYIHNWASCSLTSRWERRTYSRYVHENRGDLKNGDIVATILNAIVDWDEILINAGDSFLEHGFNIQGTRLQFFSRFTGNRIMKILSTPIEMSFIPDRWQHKKRKEINEIKGNWGGKKYSVPINTFLSTDYCQFTTATDSFSILSNTFLITPSRKLWIFGARFASMHAPWLI